MAKTFYAVIEQCKFYAILILAAGLIIAPARANKCVQQGPCVCKFDDYKEINLEDLIPAKSDQPFLRDADGNNTYFFAGCKNQAFDGKKYGMNVSDTQTGSLIKCVTSIVNKTIIIHDNDTVVPYNVTALNYTCSAIGLAQQILFVESEHSNDYQLVYNRSKVDNLPSVQIVCIDRKMTYLKATGSADSLVLFSNAACLKNDGSPGLSSGSIFLLLFFVFTTVYLVGGGLVMHFVRGARGIEVIPNIDFWRSLPGLVRDGTVFIFSGCRPTTVISTAETYDRI